MFYLVPPMETNEVSQEEDDNHPSQPQQQQQQQQLGEEEKEEEDKEEELPTISPCTLVSDSCLQITISTTEHVTTKVITSLHSQSTAHSSDINISYF